MTRAAAVGALAAAAGAKQGPRLVTLRTCMLRPQTVDFVSLLVMYGSFWNMGKEEEHWEAADCVGCQQTRKDT